ncbi:MAG: flagellar assembly protein FliW [Micrococcales bacterium]|nr:flagellar assembly protein FliW [Micrococcales bacterium]
MNTQVKQAATDQAAAPTCTEESLVVATVCGSATVPARLDFVDPLPGLPGRTTYDLQALDDLGVLFAIRSDPLDGPQIRLFLVSPHVFFPSYTPQIPADALGTTDADTVLFVVVRPADTEGDAPTANLLAPLVVDPTTGRAAQVVLEGDHPLQAPVG